MIKLLNACDGIELKDGLRIDTEVNTLTIVTIADILDDLYDKNRYFKDKTVLVEKYNNSDIDYILVDGQLYSSVDIKYVDEKSILIDLYDEDEENQFIVVRKVYKWNEK